MSKKTDANLYFNQRVAKHMDRLDKQVRQQNKAIRRKNRLIHRLRYDNPHYRKWCYLYWGEQKNPWVQNKGGFPEKMPYNAKIDIVRSDGTKESGVYATSRIWDMIDGLYPYIVKWRFHNSRREEE